MRQDFTLPEMQTALRIARILPAPTSPLAGVQPASGLERSVIESLRRKQILDDSQSLGLEWRGALATLADPSQQATVHVEGVGTARYYGSVVGTAAAMVPIENGQQRILAELSTDTILTEIDDLLRWRNVPDAPPLRVDLSIEELTTIASLADARREEQLRAAIERRSAIAGPFSREKAERQITVGQSNPDSRWLISILSRFAPESCRPAVAALDPGAAALLGRGWAKPGDGGLELGPDLETLCDGFAFVVPFLAVSVGAPWAEPSMALFTRGWQNFWGLEFHSEGGRNWVSLSRLGAKAMEEVLRRHLASFVSTPRREPISQKPPKPKSVEPLRFQENTVPPQAVLKFCSSCGKELKPGKRFCTSCGTPIG